MTEAEALTEALQATLEAERPDLFDRLLARTAEVMLGLPEREAAE